MKAATTSFAPMAGDEKRRGSGGGATSPFAGLRKIDDLVFAVEEVIVITALIAMAVMVFLDVVYRRLSSQDSKVGAVLARIFGVEDPATRALLDETVAPTVGTAIGIALVWFAFWSAERHKGAPLLAIRGANLVLTAVTSAAIALCCWLMLELPSKFIYLMIYAGGVALWATPVLRAKAEGWVPRIAIVALVVTPLFVWLAWTYFPEGYTWSQELSLMLLLWIGFMGASVCAHEGRHLRMEAFDKALPAKAARFIHAIGYFGTAAFCAFMMVLGYRYVFDPETGMRAIGGVSAQMRIPDWLSTVAVPIAFGFTMVRFIGAGISALLGGTYGKPPKDQVLAAAAQGVIGPNEPEDEGGSASKGAAQ